MCFLSFTLFLLKSVVQCYKHNIGQEGLQGFSNFLASELVAMLNTPQSSMFIIFEARAISIYHCESLEFRTYESV